MYLGPPSAIATRKVRLDQTRGEKHRERIRSAVNISRARLRQVAQLLARISSQLSPSRFGRGTISKFPVAAARPSASMPDLATLPDDRLRRLVASCPMWHTAAFGRLLHRHPLPAAGHSEAIAGGRQDRAWSRLLDTRGFGLDQLGTDFRPAAPSAILYGLADWHPLWCIRRSDPNSRRSPLRRTRLAERHPRYRHRPVPLPIIATPPASAGELESRVN